MSSITVRNVPPALHREMRVRAERSRRSLQEYLLGLMEADAALPPLDALLDSIERRLEEIGTTLSAEAIVEGIAADRDAACR